MSIYFKELTTPDIKSTGMRVIKVIVPGLIDMPKSNILREDAKRFWKIPIKFNLKIKEFCKKPHPFP